MAKMPKTRQVDDRVIDDDAPSGKRAPRPSSNEILPAACLLSALDRAQRRRLLAKGPLAFIVEVPGAGWVEPIRRTLADCWSWGLIVARTGADRADNADPGNEAVAAMLASGERVAGVAPAPARMLPSALVGAADLGARVVVSDDAIAEAILAVTGRRPRGLPKGVADGLEFADIVAAIRSGDSAASAVARLEAVARARGVVDRSLADAPDFDSLCGFGPAKDWGDDLLRDLNDWRAGTIPFSAIASRAVLASPPGLGKTTFVRSLAKAARLPLVATSVSSWFANSPGFLDSVVKQIDALWRVSGPSIVFIDEADAIPNRESLEGRNRDYWVTVVNHLLLRLDSAVSGPSAQTVVIAATNHAQRLDPALVRAGRLDRILHVGLPDSNARLGILKAHLSGALVDVDLGPAARASAGMTGADLAQAVKQARRTARIAGRPLAAADLMDAIAPPDGLSDDQRWRIAVHESGHAVARLALGQSVDFVTLRARGMRGAVVSSGGPNLPLREDVERTVVPLLCGRAAEEAVLGTIGLGSGGSAGSDLAQATNMLAAAHASFGAGTGLVWRGAPEQAGRLVAEDGELRGRVEADLDRLYRVALRLMRERRREVTAVARRLVAAEHLGGQDVASTIRRVLRRKDRGGDP